PACIIVAAGRKARNTPNPVLTRLPYALFSPCGTKPADKETPTPGFSPFHVGRYRVYPPCSFATVNASSESATARSWAVLLTASNLPNTVSRSCHVRLVSTRSPLDPWPDSSFRPHETVVAIAGRQPHRRGTSQMRRPARRRVVARD